METLRNLSVARTLFRWLVALAVFQGAYGSEEQAPVFERTNVKFIRAYEPIHVGYTFDEGDQPFLDFGLSLMFPARMLLPIDMHGTAESRFPNGEGYVRRDGKDRWIPRAYVAFNGRAGQYIETRESSPVVGKRFNPVVAFRWWNERVEKSGLEDYFELSYGHESNGQRLGSSGQTENIDWGSRYQTLRNEYYLSDGEPSIARDEISRGWDYIGTRWSKSWIAGQWHNSMLFQGKAFLRKGIMQSNREDYSDWEGEDDWLAEFDGEIVRHKVDGLSARFHFKHAQKDKLDFTLELKTGYKEPFKRMTYRLEYQLNNYTIWYRNGYNSDFANYYHKDESWGIALKIRQF